MDIIILPLSLISIICICIMIGVLVFAYIRNWLMTFAIIIANFIVFFLSIIFTQEIIGELAFRPIYLTFEYFPQIYTLFTSMFLHSTYDLFHIIFNVLMFLLIAPSFEGRIGRKKFLGVYILTGVFAALFHALVAPIFPSPIPFDPEIGLIGASGAISGILGAYAYSYPKDRVFFPVLIIIRMPVLYAGLIFVSIQTIYIFIGGDPHVAYLAHIGGFIGGVVLAALFIRGREKEMKTHTQTVYYDSNTLPKPSRVRFSNLRNLAKTLEQKEMLSRIEKETVPQVRDIWTEHFLDKTKCPKCGEKLNHFDNKIWCEKCGFKTGY